MTTLNPTYISNIPFSQHEKYKNNQIFIQSKVAIDKFNKGYLHYKIKLTFDCLSRADNKNINECFGLDKIPESCFKLLRRLSVYLKENHYNYSSSVINICQKTLAEAWGIDPSTVRRQMKVLQQLGVVVDSEGKKFKADHPLYKHFDPSYGPKKQYFISFDGLFGWVKDILSGKRLMHVYREKSLSKTQESIPPMPLQNVDKPKENLVENKIVTPPDPCINARYNENINIFNNNIKKINGIFKSGAQKMCKFFSKEDDPDVYRLSKGPDDGAFSDLFSPNLLKEFERMSEPDKNLFLKFKRQQIIHYMRQYSAYSSRQERANRGLAVLEALSRPRQFLH